MLLAANYIGDASFALTGSLLASSEGMDLLGCNLVGSGTALGGGGPTESCRVWAACLREQIWKGMLRDIVLGNLPVSWATSYDEILLCARLRSHRENPGLPKGEQRRLASCCRYRDCFC